MTKEAVFGYVQKSMARHLIIPGKDTQNTLF